MYVCMYVCMFIIYYIYIDVYIYSVAISAHLSYALSITKLLRFIHNQTLLSSWGSWETCSKRGAGVRNAMGMKQRRRKRKRLAEDEYIFWVCTLMACPMCYICHLMSGCKRHSCMSQKTTCTYTCTHIYVYVIDLFIYIYLTCIYIRMLAGILYICVYVSGVRHDTYILHIYTYP